MSIAACQNHISQLLFVSCFILGCYTDSPEMALEKEGESEVNHLEQSQFMFGYQPNLKMFSATKTQSKKQTKTIKNLRHRKATIKKNPKTAVSQPSFQLAPLILCCRRAWRVTVLLEGFAPKEAVNSLVLGFTVCKTLFAILFRGTWQPHFLCTV